MKIETVTTKPRHAANLCQWFLRCTNLATGTLSHPILGDVPICARCRAKVKAIDEAGPVTG